MRLHQAGRSLTLAVADDGCGYDPEAQALARPAATGAGLRSIEVRVCGCCAPAFSSNRPPARVPGLR
ncbi:MAG: hypothetical protein WKG07_21015 [Hymenobacter sp.]